jgi:hypothetical protein
LLLLLQLPLILNPGYLSFDELQWWARADVPAFADLPWVAWTDLRAFQYRPLTFNLWLVLAHLLAAHACAMHALFVLLGTINALLLAACLRRLDVSRSTAAVAAVAFVLSPYAAYTHGWTGTLGDLLVLLFGLLGVCAMLWWPDAARRNRLIALLLALLIILALLAKEAAVAVPPLWLAVAAARHGWRRAVAFVAPAALIVVACVAARVPALWLVGAGNEGYAWHLANVPPRLAEYALFPWLPPLFEVGPTLHKSPLRLGFAALCHGAVVFALLRTSWRHAAAWMLLGTIALAPVLVLGRSFDQYAYLASATAVGVAAHAWRDGARAARCLLLIAGAIACVHGVQIMLRMREVGAIEQRFHGDLIAALSRAGQPLRIGAARAADAWMVERWVGNVPSYRGVVLAGRVTTGSATPGATALTMQPDGALATTPAAAR